MLCRGGAAVGMSVDHKASSAAERRRIERVGHSVVGGRVDGCLNVARGLGDWRFKARGAAAEAHAVTSVPDVRWRALGLDDEFLVLGCDGLWDCMSSQQVCNFVRLRLLPRTSWTAQQLAADQGVRPDLFDPFADDGDDDDDDDAADGGGGDGDGGGSEDEWGWGRCGRGTRGCAAAWRSCWP